MKQLQKTLLASSLATLSLLTSCYPVSGPDKTPEGLFLGSAWGAGTGAIMGNQVGGLWQGAIIGASLGAASGLMSGATMDIAEGEQLRQKRQLNVIKAQVAENQRALLCVQDNLDEREKRINSAAINQIIFFEPKKAFMKLGAVKQLEEFAQAAQNNPYLGVIEVNGFAEEYEKAEDNLALSSARAQSVASFLSAKGIDSSQIKVIALGAAKPISENNSEMNLRVEVYAKPK